MSMLARYQVKSLTPSEFVNLYEEAKARKALPFEVEFWQDGDAIRFDTDYESADRMAKMESFLSAYKLYKRIRDAGCDVQLPQLKANGEIVFEAEIPQEFAMQF
jgi:tRNA splicing endonuclease